MVEQTPSGEPEAQKRRTTRIVQTVPLSVSGVDALGQPFRERTSTLIINCHGCKYQSKHYVLKDSWVTLEIPHAQSGREPHQVRAKVTWIQKPKTIRELFQVGVELEVPGNVWGIAFPPPDWFPFPEEGVPSIPPPSPPAEESRPHPAVEEEKLRAVPPPGEVATAAQFARLMEKLVTEARQQVQRIAQETAAEETTRAMRELSAQMQQAAEKAVEAAAQSATDQAMERALGKIEEVEQARSEAMQQAWTYSLERSLREASEQLAARVEETVGPLEEAFRQKLRAELDRATQQTQELSERMSTAARDAGAGHEDLRTRIAGLRTEIEAALESSRAAAQAERQEIEEASRKLKKDVSAAVEAARAEWREKLESDMAVAGTGWNSMLDEAVQQGTVRLAEQLDELRREAHDQAEQELVGRAKEFSVSLAQMAASAEQSLAGVRETLAKELEQSAESLKQMEQAIGRVQEFEQQTHAIRERTAEELEKRAVEIVASRTTELHLRAENIGAEVLAQIEPELEHTARVFLERLAQQAEQQLGPQLARAAEASAKLAVEQKNIEIALEAQRERLREASEEQVRATAARLSETAAQLQQEFAQTARQALEKWAAELDEKGTDITHTTFESLYKAAEWYQKKAQTAMQSALDKVVEDSSGRLREQAGEVSRLFAAELDHRSRSFAEHAEGLLEEAAREVSAKTLQRLDEYRDTRLATFDDEAHRLAENTLSKLNDATKLAVLEMKGEIEARIRQARAEAEAYSDGVVVEFQRRMQERLEEGIESARQQMGRSMETILELWNAARETEQQEWRLIQGREANETVERLRERMELASNAWLAASVASLHSHAQKGIDELSSATQEKIRETFAQALTGLADIVRLRLLNLSAEIYPPKKQEP